jgi:uncharacterized protein
MARHILGMLHLLPLPGSPRYGGSMEPVIDRALNDARALRRGGIRAMILENFGDAPFYPGPVPPVTVAAMAAVASRVLDRIDVSLGINVLRNDGCAALSIAHAVGADFIRANVLCHARLTDQGVIEGIAHDLLRLRRHLGAENIRILADVNVKHSAPLAPISVEQEAEDLIHRGQADGLIVTGAGTGKSTPLAEVERIKAAAGRTPVFVGSGVTARTIADCLAHADGAIVGSWLKEGGVAAHPVDWKRCRQLVAAAR